MENAIQWIAENWGYIVALIWGVLSVANAIVKLTKTEKDDAVVGKIRRFLDRLSFLRAPEGDPAKSKVKLPGSKSE